MVKPLIVTPDMVDDGMPADLPWVNLLDVQAGVPYNGSANCQPFLQAAVNQLAALGGGLLLIPPGVFRLDSDVTIGTDLVIAGPGATIRENGGSLVFAGSVSGTVNVTADVDRNDRSITVANGDEAGFDAGDLILVASDWFAEYHVVESTAVGQINLDTWIHNRIETDESPTVSLVTKRSMTIEGLRFHGYAAADKHLRVTYGGPVTLHGCTFTGTGAGVTAALVIDKSTDVRIEGCRFDAMDVDYKGLRIDASEFVRISGCHWYDNRNRPLQLQFCHDVAVVGNTAHKNEGYIFTVESCSQVTIAENVINWTPATYDDFDTSATSRPGIWVLGSEGVTVANNALRNCIGEGDIYLRSSSYSYNSGAKALPLRNIVISGNVIEDLLTTTTGHTAAIYAKSEIESVTIVGNAIRSKLTSIGLYNQVKDLVIADNELDSGKFPIYLGELGSDDLWTWRATIVNNHLRRSVANNGALVTAYIKPGGSLEIAGNRLEAENQAADPFLVEIGGGNDGGAVDFGDTILRIHDNTIVGDSTTRGITTSNWNTTAPTLAGAVCWRDNVIDVPGAAFGGVTTPALDVESALAAGTATPNVWGLDGKAWSTANTGAQNVTSFVGLRAGIVFHVRGNDGGNTTFVNGANLVTKSGANVTLANDETITFRAVSTTKVLEV